MCCIQGRESKAPRVEPKEVQYGFPEGPKPELWKPLDLKTRTLMLLHCGGYGLDGDDDDDGGDDDDDDDGSDEKDDDKAAGADV